MNWSMYTADRGTHLKIVVVGLAAALLIAVIGISARQLRSCQRIFYFPRQRPRTMRWSWPHCSINPAFAG